MCTFLSSPWSSLKKVPKVAKPFLWTFRHTEWFLIRREISALSVWRLQLYLLHRCIRGWSGGNTSHLHVCFFKWKECSEDASTILEHVELCRMIFDEEGNQACLHPRSQTLCTGLLHRRVIRSKNNTWMHTMRQFLAWRSCLEQYDWDRTKKFVKIIFQSKVTEVYLILYNDLEEHLWNFWLKNNLEKSQSYCCPFPLSLLDSG